MVHWEYSHSDSLGQRNVSTTDVVGDRYEKGTRTWKDPLQKKTQKQSNEIVKNGHTLLFNNLLSVLTVLIHFLLQHN